jgi:hypothetical protein
MQADLQETHMLKLLAVAGFAALVAACANPASTAGRTDPMHESRGSTQSGTSKAAALGFHGPVHRSQEMDGPN